VFDPESFKEAFEFTDEKVKKIFKAAEGEFEEMTDEDTEDRKKADIDAMLADVPSEEQVENIMERVEEGDTDE